MAGARSTVDALRPVVQSGLAGEQEVESLQAALTALASAEASRQAALDELFDSATVDLTGEQRARLSTLRSNLRRGMPTPLGVVVRGETEWLALRDALAAERASARMGDVLDPGVAAALAGWRSDPAVAAAQASLDASGAGVELAWTDAVEG